jgi:hypothetical protein
MMQQMRALTVRLCLSSRQQRPSKMMMQRVSQLRLQLQQLQT